METKSWTFVDKTTWGEGPWMTEPDKVQWPDPATGLPCLAVRGPLGSWCGYVGIAPGHPYYGLDYDDCAARPAPCGEGDCEHTLEGLLEVHGGLTFNGACREDEDRHGICHAPSPGEEARVWWLGFDACHSGDYSPGIAAWRLHGPWPLEPYRTLAYIQAQCASLAAQLAAGDERKDR